MAQLQNQWSCGRFPLALTQEAPLSYRAVLVEPPQEAMSLFAHLAAEKLPA
jgi:hypothetical protein